MRASFYRCLIPTGAVRQATGHSANRCNADASDVVDFSVGQVFLQILDDLPTIDHRLEFCGGAQIIEEIAHFSRVFKSQQRNE